MSLPNYFIQFSPHVNSGLLKNCIEEFIDEELNWNQDLPALFVQLNAESEGKCYYLILEWSNHHSSLKYYYQNSSEIYLFSNHLININI